MKLDLYRFVSESNYSYGILMIDGQVEAFTLEDEHRSQKVKGETRIPMGTFEVKHREVLSGLTKKYRKYDWFTWHLQLQDVPGFNYVYIHKGNYDTNTDGCILVANTCDLTPNDDRGFIGESTDCFKKVYHRVSEALINGEKVTISIYDKNKWIK